MPQGVVRNDGRLTKGSRPEKFFAAPAFGGGLFMRTSQRHRRDITASR